MTDDKVLRIKAEAKQIQQTYNSNPRTNSYNAIIYGKTGSGKTSLLRTCRMPIHVDSFDPGGTKVLEGSAILNEVEYQDEMKKGNIIVDSRFEDEDPLNPKVAKLWDDEYHRRKKLGYFNYLGTYVIDSMTTWAQCIMYAIMKKAGRVGAQPFQQDWLPQMTVIENSLRDMVTLPCDCVLIGHADTNKDDATGKMFISLMVTGKLTTRIPLLFDEIYYANTKETSKGIEYQLLTRSTGLYTARSRLAKDGKIDIYEPPVIKDILKKAGKSTKDKEPLI